MIIVFGSLNMDLVMTVASLPRPGETVLCPDYALKPGGKGANQAVAARRAGAEVVMAGCLGPDGFGQALRENLTREGVDAGCVATVDRPTGCATICVDAKGENAIVVASGANLSAGADQVPESRLGSGTTVLMQMEVPAAENWALVARARARGARTVLNLAPAAPVPPDTLRDLDVLVVNELEILALARQFGLAGPAAGDGDVAGLARAVAGRFGPSVIVTLGGAGAVAALGDGTLMRVGALPIEPVDTTGAGDAFCGVLTAALDRGAGFADALHRAAVGAGLACLGLGAQESLPRAGAVDARLRDLPAPGVLT
ncbi:MAG TPA: ribokinase [Arenibaculum sp.]|nr:ribokinase [Arenibaculum sp.]